MTRTVPIFTAIMAAALCAACAPVEREPVAIAGLSTDRQCFFTRTIDGYSDAPDGKTGERLYITTGPRQRWLFETFGPCPELDWTFKVALDARSATTVCTGDTATLIVPTASRTMPARCTVRLLGKMEDAR